MSNILLILFISFSCASFANWFDDCLGEGMIFEWWGNFVKGKFWLKPLGGCLICTCTWVSIFASMCAFVALGLNVGQFILLTLVIVSISNTFLKFIIK